MRLKHPAKMWPTRWIWDDRSDEDVKDQILDALIDVRNLLVLVLIAAAF